MDQFLEMLGVIAPYALAALIGWILIKYGISFLKSIFSQGTAGSIAVVAVAIVAAVAAAVIFQPTFAADFLQFSARQPDAKVRDAEAQLMRWSLNPQNDPSKWTNEISRAVAESVRTGYAVETAQNTTKITQAEAERACYRPPGHIERLAWDSRGLDPCSASTPAGWQALQRQLGQVDLSGFTEDMGEPGGTAPEGSSDWLRNLLGQPKGLLLVEGLIGLAIAKRIAG